MTNACIAASVDQPILLISDLHLAPQRPATIELAHQYLQQAHGASALFIIGDLFEYWLGDDAIDPAMQPTIDALRAVSQSGTQLYLMHGNRDFLLGEQFAKQIGAALIRDDEIVFHMNDQAVTLLHGDTLCTDDHGYQQLRTMLRAPAWQQEFLSKTVPERVEIAAQLRDKSREAVADKSLEIMDVNAQTVNAAFEQHGPPLMIHGHTHRPQDHLGAQRRLVLGDWHDDHAMVGRFDGETFVLERFARKKMGTDHD
ncbi:MAG: UDP-2,3-diacylglucosamine diphosphatase [Granulosicoccaceae bacterium]